MNEYQSFCLEAYTNFYDEKRQELITENEGTSGKLSKSKADTIETESQKYAIREALISGAKQFPHANIAEIWNAIFAAHMYRKSGISDKTTIDRVIGADQSWKKSSGHAFEEMIKELGKLNLQETNIEIILQRDLNTLIKANELHNEPRDISWLKEQIKGNIFDLYAIIKTNEKNLCFGCIQAKTSIRDRVTRDREPSIHAMQSFFWSAIIVLDGDFLKLPKFNHMVNGGSEEFRENGWHGMYVFSNQENNDRIYSTNLDLETFKTHLVKAANYWQTQRQWMNNEWRAE
jgi:hypothetical protein